MTTKARQLADLLDTNGDVKSSALDNVPASDNATALTTGTLAIARLADGSITPAKLHNDAKVVKSTTAPSNPVEGNLWYDTQNDTLKVYDTTASAWVKLVLTLSVLSSISGDILNATAGNLTLTGTGFLSSGLIVSFTPSGGSVSNVTVTPSSDTSATVAVPSAIYGQSLGTVVAIKVTNSDGKVSATINKTVVGLPTGGTITNSGGYRIHTFTSSGTFVQTLSTLNNVEYLVLAGGGGGGSRHGGGGGGGGYRSSVVGENSGKGSSAETRQNLNAGNYTVTVGGGGVAGYGDGGLYAVGKRGGNSVFGTITSTGGGGGMNDGDPETERDGGTGGGGDYRSNSHGTGTAGQGYDGGDGSGGSPYHGGGGGGTGQIGGTASGSNSGAGGNGTASSITGSSVTRGGGGSGGVYSSGSAGSGGSGGGGVGSAGTSGATNGTTNLGGGGGALGEATGTSGTAGTGGSGIVIVRYQV